MSPRSPREIAGWAEDDHAAALAAFAVSADLYGMTDLPGPQEARAVFEERFDPVEIVPPGAAHFTAYYEPELAASLTPDDRFCHALYGPPPGFAPGEVWHSRAEIRAGDLLRGQEIAWVESAIEAFLAQVQGSVRLRLPDGRALRLGFAGKNGHPYRSIGAELIRRNVSVPAEMTPDRIRCWCRANPGEVDALLDHNPSFVFFRVLDLPEGSGPLGAMGRPVVPGRSLAVDPEVIPLGSPVWVDCPHFGARLMVAQDIGSAIKGAGRGDLFIGSGAEAGRIAGAINARGAMVLLRRRG